MNRLDELIEKAIFTLKLYEPRDGSGYYNAFSGGKDSVATTAVLNLAEVKFDSHYNVTTIDPPELVYFIREHHPDVIWNYPKEPFLKKLTTKGFPRRQGRWCCEYYKEHGGEGRVCVTGVRWAESHSRSKRGVAEVVTKKRENAVLFNDNEDGRRQFENCAVKGKKVVNPIIAWTENDVWEFIRSRNLPYCKLYDEGWKRIGCLMCPIASSSHRSHEANSYPKITKNFIRAFEKLYENRLKTNPKAVSRWISGEDMFNWWLLEKKYVPPNQMKLEDIL